MAEFPYPDEATTVTAYQDRVRAEYQAVGRQFPDPNDADAFRWFTRYGYSCRAMPEPEAATKHLRELHEALHAGAPPPPPPTPAPGQPTNRPLIGPLRIQDTMFRDDSGWRRVLFCSWFPALRILRDDPAEFERQMNAIAAAGYQGLRVFLAVGGWTPYWDGREVVPIRFQKAHFDGNHLRPVFDGPWLEAWPDYDDLLRRLARACRSRKLRLHVTTGDMQIIDRDGTQEIALHHRWAQILAEEGGSDLVALYEVTNEFVINRFGGDSTQSIAQMGQVIQAVKSYLPNVLTAMGAIPQDEEVAELEKMSMHGEVCVSHTTRSPFDKCLKRTFGLVYWEGNYRGFSKPFKQGEPAGPGEDSYQRLDEPAALVALYAMHALTGQDSNWFQGAAVRSHRPLESDWGFREMPALLATLLPEDIAQWEHGSDRHGGIEYWWKGTDFRTATYREWNTNPPRPIASWTLYTGVDIATGTGTPPRVTGLLAGTFA